MAARSSELRLAPPSCTVHNVERGLSSPGNAAKFSGKITTLWVPTKAIYLVIILGLYSGAPTEVQYFNIYKFQGLRDHYGNAHLKLPIAERTTIEFGCLLAIKTTETPQNCC